MKNLLVPTKLTVCKLTDGHKVRVVSWDKNTDKLQVKSLRTGLPFRIDRAFVFELGPTC